MHIHPATVQKHLTLLQKKRIVNRRQPRYKTVFYSRCENARLQQLIDGFMKEIEKAFSKLPGEMSAIDKQLIEGSMTKAEGEKAIEILRSELAFLKGQIMNTLVRKVFKLLNDNLPEPLRGKDYYIGVFEEKPIHLVPRSVVEDKSVRS